MAVHMAGVTGDFAGMAMLMLAQGGGSEVLGAPSGSAPAGPAGGGGESGAAGTAAPGQGGPPAGTAPASPFGMMLPLVFGLIIFMMITSMMSGRKEKKKRASMLEALKKRDRVQTYGGIIGTVVEMKDDELVLKVDESSNTRIRFSRSAIQQVLKSARGPAGSGMADGVEEVELENERYEDEAEVRV